MTAAMSLPLPPRTSIHPLSTSPRDPSNLDTNPECRWPVQRGKPELHLNDPANSIGASTNAFGQQI